MAFVILFQRGESAPADPIFSLDLGSLLSASGGIDGDPEFEFAAIDVLSSTSVSIEFFPNVIDLLVEGHPSCSLLLVEDESVQIAVESSPLLALSFVQESVFDINLIGHPSLAIFFLPSKAVDCFDLAASSTTRSRLFFSEAQAVAPEAQSNEDYALKYLDFIV